MLHLSGSRLRWRLERLEQGDCEGVRYIIASVPEGEPEPPSGEAMTMTEAQWVALYCTAD